MQSVGQRKVSAAAKRAAVLGHAASAPQLEELARLLPMAEVEVEHARFRSPVSRAGEVYEFPGGGGVERLMSGTEAHDYCERLDARLRAQPLGGITTVTIRSGELEFSASADCRVTENYHRQLGIAIAFGRALKMVRIQSRKPVGLAFAGGEPTEAINADAARSAA